MAAKRPKVGGRVNVDGVEGTVQTLLAMQFTYTIEGDETGLYFCLFNKPYKILEDEVAVK